MTCLHICLRVYIINYFLLKVCLNNHAFVKSIPIVYRKSYMCVYKHVKMCLTARANSKDSDQIAHLLKHLKIISLGRLGTTCPSARRSAEGPADPSLPDSGPGFHCSHVTKVMLTHGMAQ